MPDFNPVPGPGIWCVTAHSVLGIFYLYNLNKFSFDGELLYRSEAFPYIGELEIKSDSGDLYHTMGKAIDNSNVIVKRDNAGNQLASSFIAEGYGLHDISVNQADGSVWISRGSYPCQIVHLDKDFNTLLDGINIIEAIEVSCDPITNQCWTHGKYPGYGLSHILKLDADGNVYIGGETYAYIYGAFEASYSDHGLWAFSHKYNEYGYECAEIDVSGYHILDVAVDQDDGSVYYCLQPLTCFVGKISSQLQKFSSEGQLVWARNLDCMGISLTDTSIWVFINPNIIMQLTKNGDILSHFQTTELITDLAVWNG